METLPVRSSTLPIVITSLDDVPMGAIVKNVADTFDEDPEVRYELLSLALTHSAVDRLYREEIEELPDNLLDSRGGTWWREGIAMHLTLLRMMVSKIEEDGTEEPLIVTPETIGVAAGVARMREDWLASPELQKTIRALEKVMEKAMYWFNVQFVAGLIQQAVHRSAGRLTYAPCKNMAYEDQPEHQCQLVSDFGYFQARMALAPAYGNAVMAVLKSKAPARARKIFCFSRKQLMEFAAVRMGADIPVEKFQTEPIEGAPVPDDDDTPETLIRQWKTARLLWIPKPQEIVVLE